MVKREGEVKMEPTEASIHEPVRGDETVFKREYPEGNAIHNSEDEEEDSVIEVSTR